MRKLRINWDGEWQAWDLPSLEKQIQDAAAAWLHSSQELDLACEPDQEDVDYMLEDIQKVAALLKLLMDPESSRTAVMHAVLDIVEDVYLGAIELDGLVIPDTLEAEH